MALDRFTAAWQSVRDVCRDADVEAMSPVEAAEVVEVAAEMQKLAGGLLMRAVRRVDETVVGEGEASKARWLAMRTGQSTRDARRDIAVSDALPCLLYTSRCV